MRQVNSSMIRDNTGADYRWVRRGLTLETENNKCDKHVFEQGRNGFVTIFPTSEYSPWGITHLSIPNCTTFTYVSRPYSLHVKSPHTAFVLRCPIRCLLYALHIAASSRSLGGFFQPPAAPRHTLLSVPYYDCGILGIWLKDKKGARIRIPCPFTGWHPQRQTSTAKVTCVFVKTMAMMSYSTPAYRTQHARCKKPLHVKWRQKKTAVAFASYSRFFFFCLTCMARVDLQKDCKINMPKCLVMCELCGCGFVPRLLDGTDRQTILSCGHVTTVIARQCPHMRPQGRICMCEQCVSVRSVDMMDVLKDVLV
jgi:hypothetical protein